LRVIECGGAPAEHQKDQRLPIGAGEARRYLARVEPGKFGGDVGGDFAGGLAAAFEHLRRLALGHAVEIVAGVDAGAHLGRQRQRLFAAPAGNVICGVFDGGIFRCGDHALLDIAHVDERQTAVDGQRL
jgi:hypothetical protein